MVVGRTLVAVLGLLAGVIPASAQMIYGDFKAMQSDERVQYYVTGITEGMIWANYHQQEKGEPLIFCPPLNTKIGFTETKEALVGVEKLMGIDAVGDLPLGMVIYLGMQNEYPCD